MIYSMTGFARVETRDKWGSGVWELRAVNHRFLELNIRLPETFRYLEGEIRGKVKDKLGRGKVDLTLVYQPNPELGAQITVNTALVRQLKQAYDELETILPALQPVDALDLFKWPGVMQTETVNPAQLESAILAGLDQGLQQLGSVRQREGENLKNFILQRINDARREAEHIAACLPELNRHLREKLQERLNELQIKVEASRIEQEIALQLQRADASEELDRLMTHLREVERVLRQGGAAGRRLDFLMQELHREANTLGVKAVDTRVTASVVELKVLIEQMREQVQNIE